MHEHGLLEAAASVVLLSSGMILVPRAWLARSRAPARPSAIASPPRARAVRAALQLQSITAASLSLAAAIIHLAVAPQHAAEYPPFGVTFVVVAVAQAAAAAAIMAFGAGRVRMPAIALTIGILLIWGCSRVAGLPIGPEPWTPEHLGTTDGIAAVLESAEILVLLVPIRRLLTGVQWMPTANAMSVAVVPVIGTVGLATMVAIAALHAGHH